MKKKWREHMNVDVDIEEYEIFDIVLTPEGR